MTQGQKELLYHITCVYSDIFCLAMNEQWSSWDYEQDARLNQRLRKFEKEYKAKYGPLPDWEWLIENVKTTRDNLKKELKENGQE